MSASKLEKTVVNLERRLREAVGWGSHGDLEIGRIIQCEAPKIAKLFYNSNNYGL